MLRDWQLKFSKSFAEHPNILTQLSFSDQECLSRLLTLIEGIGLELLDEYTCNCILDNAPFYLPELVYLITLLAELHILNKPMLHYLFTDFYLPELRENISALSPISADTVTFLFSTRKVSECVAFITRALKAGVDFVFIKDFLSQQIDIAGLSRAIILFDFSSFDYRKEHFLLFSVVTKVLANPLSQTIFDARLRCFSDYSMPSEPLCPKNADAIIQHINSLHDQEQRIHVFFNFFAQFRPFPGSQKYLMEIDIAFQINMELVLYCKSKIATIQNQQDYLQVREMINILRTKGGNKIVFEQIKYAVASSIESEDFCSTRNYQQLMDEIWQALIKPQVNLDSFVESLQKSKGYREYVAGAALRGKAVLMSSAAMCLSDEYGNCHIRTTK